MIDSQQMERAREAFKKEYENNCLVLNSKTNDYDDLIKGPNILLEDIFDFFIGKTKEKYYLI